MAPITLCPLPTSIPFDDLMIGQTYLVELRPWVSSWKCVRAVFVELKAQRGEPLAAVMLLPGGQFVTFWRPQILQISIESSN
jgi:hypothetical protein